MSSMKVMRTHINTMGILVYFVSPKAIILPSLDLLQNLNKLLYPTMYLIHTYAQHTFTHTHTYTQMQYN